MEKKGKEDRNAYRAEQVRRGASMTNDELLKRFDEEFDRQYCYDDSCAQRYCFECSIYKDCFAQYKEDLGFVPTIQV